MHDITLKRSAPNHVEVLRGESRLGHIIGDESKGYGINYYGHDDRRVDDPTDYEDFWTALGSIVYAIGTERDVQAYETLLDAVFAEPRPAPKLVWVNAPALN